METIDGRPYLTAQETAARLSVSVGTLVNQRTERRSPMRFIKRYGRVFYLLDDVEAYARTLGI